MNEQTIPHFESQTEPLPRPAAVAIKLLPGGFLPGYASPCAAGCDLTATTDIIIRPGETTLLPLGFVMALPPDCEAQIRPRSGLSLRTALRLPNSPGTIDADYRDEVGVILENTFNPAVLPGLIAADAGLLTKLRTEYRLVPLCELLKENGIKLPEKSEADKEIKSTDNSAEAAPFVKSDDPLLAAWLQQSVWVDAAGLPYGTIHIKAGDRIAQMVVTSVRRAEFDPETDPNSTGHNRGGGFGSTGIDTTVT